jgi:hypothetical protein
MKRALLWPLAALLLIPGGLAEAACHPDGSVNIYNGTIGKVPVRVALQADTGKIDGRYAYLVSTADIVLKGRLDAAGKHLTLTEFDSAGHPQATFDGTFADTDASGTKLNCETLSGKWQSAGKPPVAFTLSLDSSGALQLAHLYGAAGVTDDAVVDRAATAFRNAVIHNQKDVAAGMMLYPFETNVNGKRTKIANAQAFLAHYDAIFTPAFRAAIAADFPRLMFARDQGVALGGGDVWFDPSGKVITLNN